MKFLVIPTKNFYNQLKSHKKKYPSILSDLKILTDSLVKDPIQGDSLGKNCYKIRMQIKSKNKGKWGVGRIITFVEIIDEKVYLLAIYDKSEKENITDNELIELLKNIDF